MNCEEFPFQGGQKRIFEQDPSASTLHNSN